MADLVTDKNGIMAAIEANSVRLRQYGVRRIGLFGSFVRGDEHGDSDIDLLVEFEQGRKTFDSFMSLAFYLEDLLGRKVEVVTAESLSPYLGPYILDEVEYVTIAA
ncbi:MAG: nucleotidyltransferase family protein [Candidatus Latescibacteria bacterium]|jgi:hypothetical protein|nr:nucleotidyltransferase family protein [Candidatus Latescibacterota bacterium]